MKIESLPAKGVSFRACAACFGRFGTLHTGQTRVIAETVRIARKTGLPACVCLLKHEDDPLPIETRAELMEAMGVDYVETLILDDTARRCQGGLFFDDVLGARLHARHLVTCRTIRFGRGRMCDVDALRVMCSEAGLTLTVLSPSRTPDGLDITDELVMRALRVGDVTAAAFMLGREPEQVMTDRAERALE